MKSTRESYGEFLVSKGYENKDIVVFDADLANATCTKLFKKDFPTRHNVSCYFCSFVHNVKYFLKFLN